MQQPASTRDYSVIARMRNLLLQPGSSETWAQEVPGVEVSCVDTSVMSENCSGLQS